jgi:hypothetical protein
MLQNNLLRIEELYPLNNITSQAYLKSTELIIFLQQHTHFLTTNINGKICNDILYSTYYYYYISILFLIFDIFRYTQSYCTMNT